MTPESLIELREQWTGSRERLARMLDAMDIDMRAKHGHGLPREVMALGNVFHPEAVVAGLLDALAEAARDNADLHRTLERQRELLAGVAIGLRGEPPELASWGWADLPERAKVMRAERDELAAEVAALRTTAGRLAQRAEDDRIDRVRYAYPASPPSTIPPAPYDHACAQCCVPPYTDDSVVPGFVCSLHEALPWAAPVPS